MSKLLLITPSYHDDRAGQYTFRGLDHAIQLAAAMAAPSGINEPVCVIELRDDGAQIELGQMRPDGSWEPINAPAHEVYP